MVFDLDNLGTFSSGIIYLICATVIFTETGLFFGVIFPGDSLLFYLGLLCADGVINLWLTLLLLVTSSVLGYFFGYWQGKHLSHWLEERPDSLFFQKTMIIKVKKLFAKYGAVTILFAKVIPVARSFSPYVAGMVNMRFDLFCFFNVVGSLIWISFFLVLGNILGHQYPNILKVLLPWIGAGIVCLFLGTFVTYYIKNKKQS
jgi:membrane-associated protein